MPPEDLPPTVVEVPHTFTSYVKKKQLVDRLQLRGHGATPTRPAIYVMGRHLPELAAATNHSNHLIVVRRVDGKGRLSLTGLDQLSWTPGPLSTRIQGAWVELFPSTCPDSRNSCRLLDGSRITLSAGVRTRTTDDVLVVADLDDKRLFVAAPSVVLQSLTTITPHTPNTEETSHA